MLYNTAPTIAEDRAFHVAQARGLMLRAPGENRLSVASLEVTDRACAP
jgi:hypothetical protein